MSLVSFVLKMMTRAGGKVAAGVDRTAEHPKEEQEKLLLSILAKAKNSELGKKLDYASITNPDDFRAKVPLTDYDYYSEYIERMTKGEQNLITNQKIIHLNVTSGTMGVPKKIPVTEDHVSVFAKFNAKYLNYIVARELGNTWTRGSELGDTCVPNKRRGTAWTHGRGLSLAEGTYETLPCGLTVGCASSLQAARMETLFPGSKFDVLGMMYTSPREARRPAALGTYSRYLHALFALREKNITYGNVTFSSIFLELLRFIETRWEMLCDDIEKGTIDPSVDMPIADRISAEARLTPNPQRAAELREIFKNHVDEPFGKLIWPNLHFFMMVAGAGFQTYTDKILDRYMGKDFHVLYFGLSSSEGMYSVPLKLDCPDAVFLPDATFMEFIPVSHGESDLSGGTKLLHELEVGKQYELVVTNVSGLVRYRLKDVIEVTGFYRKTPTMRFVNRSGYAINICAEKTSEKALQYTAEQTAKDLGLDLYDYCVYPKQDESGARYIFMYELNRYTEGVTQKDIRDATEKNLIVANPDYAEELATGSLQPTEIALLQPETFMLYRDLMIMKGRSSVQLKPVHVAATPFQQKFFLGLKDTETPFPEGARVTPNFNR